MASIDQFKAQLIGGGPRANRFRVFIPRTGNRIEFLCSAAQIPAADIGEISVKWMGNVLKLPSDRAFADWTVTIINDLEFSARSALELWQGEIAGYGDSVGSTSLDFMIDRAYVEQLDKSDAVLARYEFFNMWPKTIGPITLSYETGGESLETFDTTFSFSHWERAL